MALPVYTITNTWQEIKIKKKKELLITFRKLKHFPWQAFLNFTDKRTQFVFVISMVSENNSYIKSRGRIGFCMCHLDVEFHSKAEMQSLKQRERNIFFRRLYFSNWNLLHLFKRRPKYFSKRNVFVIFIYWWCS